MFCPKKGMPVFDEAPLKWWGLYTPFRQIYALYMRGFVQDLEYWDSTWDGLISIWVNYYDLTTTSLGIYPETCIFILGCFGIVFPS